MYLTTVFEGNDFHGYTQTIDNIYETKESLKIFLDCLKSPNDKVLISNDEHLYKELCGAAFRSNHSNAEKLFDVVLADSYLIQHPNAQWAEIIKNSNKIEKIQKLINSKHFFNYESAGYVIREPIPDQKNEEGRTLFEVNHIDVKQHPVIDFILNNLQILSQIPSQVNVPTRIIDNISVAINNIPSGLVTGYSKMACNHRMYYNRYSPPFHNFNGNQILDQLLQLNQELVVQVLEKSKDRSMGIFYELSTSRTDGNLYGSLRDESIDKFVNVVRDYSVKNKRKLLKVFKPINVERVKVGFKRLNNKGNSMLGHMSPEN